jgi:ABC-type transport system involved in multi-copper enzyme maturation permease subunit
MSFQLLRAEWIKMSRLPLAQVLILLLPGLLFVQFGIDAFSDPGRAERLLPFPVCLDRTVGAMSRLGILLAVTFAAICIGLEYQRGTWGLLLPRRASRIGFLLSKAGICVLALLLWLGLSVGVGMMGGMIGALWAGVKPFDPDGSVSTALGRGVVLLLELVLYGSAAMIATIAFRSAYAGIFFGLVPLKVLECATASVDWLACVFPFTHLANIEGRLLGYPERFPWPLEISFMTVGAYAVCSMLLAIWLFRRQEFAGT